MDDPKCATKRPWYKGLPPWYYATRLLGTVLILYGVFGDHTPERSTLILTGAGLLGIDKVTRSDPKG